MRKTQKQGILAFIKDLHKAHEEIRGAVRRKEYPSAQKMLGECQEFAVSLGGIIEETEGEGHETIAALEKYCEELFRVYEKIEETAGGRVDCVNEGRMLKSLRRQLIRVENSVKNDIPVRYEIVFLPYKASMWDSLESIWMEEKGKPENDTYVIPIPYFDKNPDGSFGDMHYEGGQYPDYVPVTDWRKYDIMERRPDIVYIHNPYDQFNLVTSVHPDFYSIRLKQCTDMLVYCPYFVGVNGHVAEHFCTTPGVLHADRVIVESESVREIYINALRKYERENNCSGRLGNLEKKIKVFEHGSPKIERVKNTKIENISIPESWKRLMEGDGTTRKKVILYNTTIDAALKNSEHFAEKIRDVLATFKRRTDVVLLWRPHPLLLSTLNAMRPEIYSTVYRLIQTYMNEGWGIYDDTADIDRAIILSDAYYGDWSSVVEMYKATGKPIMIANYEKLRD